MDMLKDILALTEIKIQILLDKETTINDMLCLQIHLQQNLNIYIYTQGSLLTLVFMVKFVNPASVRKL